MRRSTDRLQIGIALFEDFFHGLRSDGATDGGHGEHRGRGTAFHAVLSVGKCNGVTRAATVRKIGGPDLCAGEMGELGVGEVHLGRAEIVHVYQLVKEDPLHLRTVRASVGANYNLILDAVVSAEDVAAAEAGLAGKVSVGYDAAAGAIHCSQHEAYHWTGLQGGGDILLAGDRFGSPFRRRHGDKKNPTCQSSRYKMSLMNYVSTLVCTVLELRSHLYPKRYLSSFIRYISCHFPILRPTGSRSL